MPGETNSSMGFLDLQFGAMDIISDGATFDGDTNKFNTSGTNMDNTSSLNVDLNSTQQSTNLDYSSQQQQQKTGGQSSISSALTQGVSLLLFFFFPLRFN